MSHLEHGLITLILQYCTEKDFSKHCFRNLFTTPVERRSGFHPQHSNFTLSGMHIQADFHVLRLPAREGTREINLCSNLDFPKHFQKREVDISKPFLCHMYLRLRLNNSIPLTNVHLGFFQEEAQFTDVKTGSLLNGLLTGHVLPGYRNTELCGLRFFPLEWMGNPCDLATLKRTLEQIETAQEASPRNEDFRQQFYWWSKKNQESYWKSVRDLLEYCLCF